MVSDGLSMMNAQMSSSSFKLSQVKIGDRNYLGNNIFFPPAAKTGTDCLLGTKVMIPIDGAVREGVGLLGSPCFEIPRAVERDRNFTTSLDDEARRAAAQEEERATTSVTVVLLPAGQLGVRLRHACSPSTPRCCSIRATAWLRCSSAGAIPVADGDPVLRAARAGEPRLQAAAAAGRVDLRPVLLVPRAALEVLRVRRCMSLFKGTPFKNVISRLLGVKVGRKVFDDGAQYLEKTLIEIGDYANLNEASTLQGHSLEEGVFKSDYIRIGSGCTIGVQRLRALRRHHGRPCGARCRLLPDEGRDRRGACPLAR